MSGITNSSRPKHRITATERSPTPAMCPFRHLLHMLLPNGSPRPDCPPLHLPESIGELAAEEGSAQTTGETTEDNSSSCVNKRKMLDILELTDSELAADERENSSDSTGSTKTQHKKKQRHDPIDVDANNVLANINIVDLSAAPSTKTIRKDANCDLSEFFEEPAALTGKDGKVRKCRACKICELRLVVLSPSTLPRSQIREFPDLYKASISELQDDLEKGRFTSVDLVNAYIARILEVNHQGASLHAVIETNPKALQQASALNIERKLKESGDNIATLHEEGSFALLGSVVPRDAGVAAKLRASGAIMLGKTSLSEWAHFRGDLPCGFSARGGQATNPYFPKGDPSESSSGSGIAMAIGLAAGKALVLVL
ncbi:amidase signature domain-containing protein [Gautieria morchelliformis]|nr:amidase signature domain-containing protein [Gautieria morchelliformis]